MFTLEEVCTIIGIVVAGAIGGLISFVLLAKCRRCGF